MKAKKKDNKDQLIIFNHRCRICGDDYLHFAVVEELDYLAMEKGYITSVCPYCRQHANAEED